MKQKITFEEKVAFHHEVSLEIRDENANHEIDSVLRRDLQDLDDALYTLGDIDGVEVVEVYRGNDVQSTEIEVYDWEAIEDDEK